MNRTVRLAALTTAGLVLVACSSADDTASDASGAASSATCEKASLPTLSTGKLVIATGEPAYEPWVKDDAPESGEGFEAAVAYAAAEKLGFGEADVKWIRTPFEVVIAPGPKDFDWNIQQFTITADREAAVDFSSSYYDAPQAVVSYKGSPIAGATTVAELKEAKLGASVGSTSLTAAEEVIAPTSDVAVFNENADAVKALKNKTIDGIVVDLPTGFYLVDSQIDEGVMVGQLPAVAGQPIDQYGILMTDDSPLAACTTQAVDQLRADGTLDTLEAKWLPDATAATLK